MKNNVLNIFFILILVVFGLYAFINLLTPASKVETFKQEIKK